MLPLGVTGVFWWVVFGVSWPVSLLDAPPVAPVETLSAGFYVLIKRAMLWVPLGFVYGFVGKGETLKRWMLTGSATFIVVAPWFEASLGITDYLEAFYALIGVWGGLWISERSMVSGLNSILGTEKVSEVNEQPSNRRLWFRLPFTLILLAGVVWALWSFPRWQLLLGVGLFGYFILLLRFRHAWLFVIPALLPAFSLAPWTGRYFLDELDLLLLTTCAAALYHGMHPQSRSITPKVLTILFWGYGLLCMASLFIGLLPIADLGLNNFDNYLSPFNSWYVGKGFFWGFLFLALMRLTVPQGYPVAERLFISGLSVGLVLVSFIGLRERWQFADLLDFSIPYRITASFSTMHTGGAHLDTYLILLFPFIAYWVMRRNHPLVMAAGIGLSLLTMYLVVATVTRTTYVVLLVELMLLALFWVRRLSLAGNRRISGILVALLVAAVASALLYVGAESRFFQHRLKTVEGDVSVRLQHWSQTVGLMGDLWANQILGMGFGQFPRAYRERRYTDPMQGNYRFDQSPDPHLILPAGESRYLAQKVPVSDGQSYRLELDARSAYPKAKLTVPLCEKHLLNSYRCHWPTLAIPEDHEGWYRWSITIDSGEIGEGNWLTRRPVELYLFNSGDSGVVSVDNVSLRNADGIELLNNGGFSRGGDFWFFKTHEHLPWHVKNLWVSLFFEQGWLGVIIFSLLMITLLIYLSGPAWYGRHPVAAALMTAVVGFLLNGMFTSSFDAPRMTLLFFAVIGFGLYQVSNRESRQGTNPKGLFNLAR
ncbi:MAG: hypothetical protein GY703_09050 [Gammaproteobacteria bacterium]|nr:hypothetical protein [Gammaproteobacteria bacterium]